MRHKSRHGNPEGGKSLARFSKNRWDPTTQTKATLTRKVKKTPTKREEYDRARSQTPERKEYRRQHQRKLDKIAKETSKCVSCPNLAIKDQTRCEILR